MNRSRLRWILACGCVYASHAQSAQTSGPPAVAPEPPSAQKPPAEMAPSAPQVRCANNQLTIVAQNSTMRAVLAAVQSCTGVAIDVPSGAAEDRSYIRLGPGPVEDVMNTLLGSTDLDYVIQASMTDPEKIEKVVLMARSEEPMEPGAAIPAGYAMTPARRTWMSLRNTGRPALSAPTEPVDSGDKTPEPSADPSPAAPVVAGTEASPSTKPADQDATVAPAAATAPAQQTPATPQADSGATPAEKELQNKITDMEQLFEQRKKLNSGSTTNPN